jgi:hypothetical protein
MGKRYHIKITCRCSYVVIKMNMSIFSFVCVAQMLVSKWEKTHDLGFPFESLGDACTTSSAEMALENTPLVVFGFRCIN